MFCFLPFVDMNATMHLQTLLHTSFFLLVKVMCMYLQKPHPLRTGLYDYLTTIFLVVPSFFRIMYVPLGRFLTSLSSTASFTLTPLME